MKVGDRVFWTSQAGGHRRTKRGVVILELLPGYTASVFEGSSEPSRDVIEAAMRITGRRPASKLGGGGPRMRTSYVVLVGNTAYWPEASLLRLEGDE